MQTDLIQCNLVKAQETLIKQWPPDFPCTMWACHQSVTVGNIFREVNFLLKNEVQHGVYLFSNNFMYLYAEF